MEIEQKVLYLDRIRLEINKWIAYQNSKTTGIML